jgi:ribonuclease BN (tRNA processing enzyme)
MVQKIQEPSVFRYSIDVLCNGSEYSSTSTERSAKAALFLSIWKAANKCQDNTEEESQRLIARYGLDGVGSCDGLARIAADQQFKLGPVRALFLNHSSDRGQPLELISSIPSLLYANQQATISIVVPNSDVEEALEKLVQLVHGHQTYPHVSICAMPPTSSSSTTAHVPQWWKVYEDDQVLVHAGRWDPAVDPEELVLYLFTFRRLLATKSSPDSTLLCPSLESYQRTRSPPSVAWQLPMVETEGIEARLPRLGTTWVLQPDNHPPTVGKNDGMLPLSHDNSSVSTLFLVPPSGNANSTSDPGLLVRAQQQTRDWRQNCDPDLLHCFPYLLPEKVSNGLNSNLGSSPINGLDHARILLQTGSSIVTDIQQIVGREGNDEDRHLTARIVDRNQQRMHRQSILKNEVLESTVLSANRNNWPSILREFLLPVTDAGIHRDENEIDLDNLEESNDSEETVPQLLVLGTGCASPSPYRGASGYALLLPAHPSNGLPATIALAVEVGEGYCTQWHRYAGGHSFATIYVIWISHAHWDHYGGLVNLILRIRQCRDQTTNLAGSKKERLFKKQKTSDCGMRSDQVTLLPEDCPIVVAPAKVLKYLNLIFGKSDSYYKAMNLEDAAMAKTSLEHLAINSSNPILHWRNVRVDHSCIAFGFILVLQFGQGTTPYLLCYSGDTRPCRDFVKNCRTVVKQYKANGRVDFLLHEATFDESESHMSISKKHSTTKEAVMVGRDVDAERLLLTHFSQRYDSVPDIASVSNHFSRRMAVGFGLDGMRVIL